jgi:hypothetical protein
MENWKDIQGYEGLYQISDLGRVKSVDRTKILPTGGLQHLPETIMKLHNNKGYWIAKLSKKSKIFSAKVHRLVAQHFHENPENKPEVNHLNGKDDNRAISLEWATKSENMQHSFRVGTHVSPACKGEKNGQSKLTREQVENIRNKYSNSSTRKLAAEYGVSNILISKIVNNKIWL